MKITAARGKKTNTLLWIRISIMWRISFFSKHMLPPPSQRPPPHTLFAPLKQTCYHFISTLKERLCRWWMWSSPRPDAFLKCVTLPLWEHENGASSIVGSPYPACNHGSRCLPSRPSLPPVDRELWAASAVKRGCACLSPRSDRTCPTPQKEPLNRSLV